MLCMSWQLWKFACQGQKVSAMTLYSDCIVLQLQKEGVSE